MKKSKGSEHQEQSKLIEWCKWQHKQLPELSLLFAIPNGGKRPKFTAYRMKLEGQQSGVPDLFLPVPRCPYHGLFIEMKIKGNKPSPNQLEWFKALSLKGYAVGLCYDAEEAAELLTTYLRHSPDELDRLVWQPTQNKLQHI